MINPDAQAVWQKLKTHQQIIADTPIQARFAEDPQRFQRFSLAAVGMLLDYSKNHLNEQTLKLLTELAQACQLPWRIQDLLSGGIVNKSENRPALHTALRDAGSKPLWVNGVDIMPMIHDTLTTMDQWAAAIRARQYVGFSGQPVDTILHFGIGGSDLGQRMVFSALNGSNVDDSLRYQFFSYQDPEYVQQALTQYDPATTLIIVASKSFTTTETLANAQVAKQWLFTAAPNPASAARQLIAVTAKAERALAFEVAADQILPIWDWVGGRYSVWSAMSLIIAIAIGPKYFRDFLAGAAAMDQHFSQADFSANMPVILGLLDVWYNNFFAIPSRAIIPYDRRLRYFPEYLQQVYMESLGKSVDQDDQPVNYATGLVVWGGTGTNSQHSFHQLLLQGNQWSPIDFILPLHNLPLVANCLAQSQVLMTGYAPKAPAAQQIAGNRPSHTLILPVITPYALGALLALYEHRVFVNSVIWNINAFDQWGVERGKHIAQQLLTALTTSTQEVYDSSTTGLLNWVKKQRNKLI